VDESLSHAPGGAGDADDGFHDAPSLLRAAALSVGKPVLTMPGRSAAGNNEIRPSGETVVEWNAVTAIASLLSTIAFILSVLYLRAELKAMERDRYLSITNQLFALWETREFMHAQLWLLHRLEPTTWTDFVKTHRADAGEAAFHQIGSFYDRVGTLIHLGLVRQEEILPTIGAFAIALWQKIEPLVREARRIEHSTLFCNFERMLPACFECYVPSASSATSVRLFEGESTDGQAEPQAPKISQAALRSRLEKNEPLTLLDVRHPAQVAADPRTLPGAILMPIDDVERRLGELPTGREVVAYCA
jgi:hypothetical protein